MTAAGAAAQMGARRTRAGGAPAEPPVISGTVLIGQTLTATGDGPLQWLRDGVEIEGATSSTYEITAADIGPAITCEGAGGASNALSYAHATHLPDTAVAVVTAGLALADSDTTAQAWEAALGGKASALSLAAPGSSQRPAYDATGGPGGRPMLVFDGANDVLVGTATWGHAWAAWQIDVVGHLAGAESAGDLVARYAPASNSLDCGVTITPVMRLSTAGTGGAVSAGSTTLTGTHRLMTWRAVSGASGSQQVAVNGSDEDTDAITHAAWDDGAALSIAANAIGGMPTALRCLAVAVTATSTAADALTTEQRTHLAALLAYHTGASLT